jgi:HK97 family phage major capsid protein
MAHTYRSKADRRAPAANFRHARALGDFLTGVRNVALGRRGATLAFEAALGSSEAIAEDGGFLVGGEIGADLLASAFEVADIANLAQRFTMTRGNEAKLNVLKDDSRATGSRWGGIQIHHVPEGEVVQPSRPKFRQVRLHLRKMVGLCYATDDVVVDAPLLGSVIAQAFAREFAFQLDDIMFEGAGGATGLGFMNGPGKVVIEKEQGQAGATIVKENLAKMHARLPASSHRTAEWWVSQSALPAIDQFRGDEGRLMWLPVRPLEYCNVLGTEGDIVLADPQGYAIVDRGAVEAISSIHVAFLTNDQAFRFTYRYDAQPIDDKPVTPFKGSGELSRFITLETRA